MNFKEKIQDCEQAYSNLTYICKSGSIPVMLTAAHTMMQTRNDGTIKYSEPYTKAIALYVSEILDCFCLVKNKDTGIDPNNTDEDAFKNMLIDNIKDHNIKLIIDLHGAKKERSFAVELGTLNNLSSDYSTIYELIDAFNENGILNVEVNDPFKGGAITQKVFAETNADVIQVEINALYRDIEAYDKINLICKSLISFIRQYSEIIDKK